MQWNITHILSRAAVAVALLALTFGAPPPAHASDYDVVEETNATINIPLGKLRLTETVIQHGPLDINRFKMSRLRRAHLPSRGVLLLLPSLGNNFNPGFPF